ncbi:hypothetical protein LguiA_007605 [Lonicera macranthoides]
MGQSGIDLTSKIDLTQGLFLPRFYKTVEMKKWKLVGSILLVRSISLLQNGAIFHLLSLNTLAFDLKSLFGAFSSSTIACKTYISTPFCYEPTSCNSRFILVCLAI